MARKDISDYLICHSLKHWNFEGRIINGNIKTFPEYLVELTGQPEKVVWRALERACRNNFIEYGTSLRFPWITEEGAKLVGEPYDSFFKKPDIQGRDLLTLNLNFTNYIDKSVIDSHKNTVLKALLYGKDD